MPVWTLITVEEFEANAEAIIDRAEAGERFNVSRNGIITMTVVPATDRRYVEDDKQAVA
jgi:antitoxin (DNA-binding transcriptional repressor) of toxin-antitoxin stability system